MLLSRQELGLTTILRGLASKIHKHCVGGKLRSRLAPVGQSTLVGHLQLYSYPLLMGHCEMSGSRSKCMNLETPWSPYTA